MSVCRAKKIINHKKIAKENIDAVLIAKPENVTYVLGFKVESEVLILLPAENFRNLGGKSWIFLNALEYDQAKKFIETDKEFANEVEIKQIPPGQPKFVEKEMKRLKIGRLGFEEDYLSVKRYNEMKEKFAIENFIGVSESILNARLIKTEAEIERMRKASNIGDIGFKKVVESVNEGKTEKELAAEAEYAMRKAGSDGTSFDSIVASGENSAFPHSKTSENKVKNGDLIIVDIGAKYNGYCSDMTRTLIYGKVEPEKAQLLNLVNEGQQYALDQIKEGGSCMEIDKLMRDFFIKKNKEWGGRFIHGLGHGVGVEIHENPYLNPISEFILKENMVVTVEPGLYVVGLGGARTEDLVVVKKTGFVPLTRSKKFSY